MATKAKTPEQTTPVEPTPVDDQALIDEQMQAANLERMQAERKALDVQIKAAQASAPKANKLDIVIAKQERDFKWAFIALQKRVQARVDAGQSLTDAIDAVFFLFGKLLAAPDAQERAKQLENERKGSPAAQEHIRQLAASRKPAE